MKSDLAAWIDSVGSDTERAIMRLHDATQPPVGGVCSTCVLKAADGEFDSLYLNPRYEAVPFPCETVRLIAGAHRDQPGFRPGWAPTTEVDA